MKEYKGAKSKSDTVTRIGHNSLVQHGKHNDRIYLLKLAMEDAEYMPYEIARMAEEHNYSKLFCKVPGKAAPLFLSNGYVLEGFIPGFYNRNDDAFFVSKFLTTERQTFPTGNLQDTFYRLLQENLSDKDFSNDDSYTVRTLSQSDARAAAAIFNDVFESYPFPVHDPEYIVRTMTANVRYFGAFKDGRLAAAASSEIDFEAGSAEMTDFATLETHTGRNLSCRLLAAMESEMRLLKLKTLYTIARLNSIPMNRTFLRFGYRYSGTLVNNTNIAGKIESMNLYYKHL